MTNKQLPPPSQTDNYHHHDQQTTTTTIIRKQLRPSSPANNYDHHHQHKPPRPPPPATDNSPSPCLVETSNDTFPPDPFPAPPPKLFFVFDTVGIFGFVSGPLPEPPFLTPTPPLVLLILPRLGRAFFTLSPLVFPSVRTMRFWKRNSKSSVLMESLSVP